MKTGLPLRMCLVGATGLVGSSVLRGAVGRDDVRVVAVARREVPRPPGARMEALIAETSGWGDAIAAANAKVLVCALGTTMRRAGNAEAFRAVDHDLVLASARNALDAGIGHMILVSSAGADRASKSLYLRTKGETEVALAKLGLRRLDVLRPGLLAGAREDLRPLEALAMALSPVADLCLHGRYRVFRSIKADTVAEAIFALAHEKAGGRFVHDRDSMLRAIRRAGDYAPVAAAQRLTRS